MASEQYGSTPMEEEKPSLMSKVKTKAKKLKSKLKPNSSDHSTGTTTGSTDPLDQYKTGTTGQGLNEDDTSSASSSDEEDNVASTGTKTEAPFGAALSSGQTGYGQDSQTGYGVDSKASDKAFPSDPSTYKTTESSGIQEAVPTNYSYFNKDVGQAGMPTDNYPTYGSESAVPSSVGGRVAGSAPTDLSVGTESPFAKRDDTSSYGSTTGSDTSSLLSNPVDQDKGISDEKSHGGLGTAAGVAAGLGAGAAGLSEFEKSRDTGYSGMRSSSDPATTRFDEGTGTAGGAKQAMDTNFNSPNTQDQTWTQKIYNTVVGTKDAVANHPVTQKAYGGVAANLGYADKAASSDDKPISQKATEKAYEAKDSATAPLSTDTNKPILQKVTESAYGVKDAVANHPVTQRAYDGVASNLGYVDKAASSDNKPISEKVTDSAYGAKDSAASKVDTDTNKPITERVAATAYGVKDAVANHPITQSAADKLGYADQAASSDNTPVSQKASDTYYGAKDGARDAANTDYSYNSQQNKPLTEKATDFIYGTKDAVANHPVTQKAADALTFSDTPESQRAKDSAYQTKDSAMDSAYQAKDSAASTFAPNTNTQQSVRDSVANHPVTQKAVELKDTVVNHPSTQRATEYAYQTKDSAVQQTTPTHHDKALADSVTETITNLPGLLSSKLGLGHGTTTSGTTTSTTPSYTSTTPTTTTASSIDPASDHPTTAPGGIMDRVSGLATSLFGGATKPAGHTDTTPVTTPSTTTTSAPAEKYIP